MSVRLLFLKLLALAVALATSSPSAAVERLSDRQRKQAEAFATSNALFFIYHEVGHLLIDQLELPVLGREEDAADNMATYLLLRQKAPRANRILTDAARGWLLSGDKYDVTFDKSDFYDAHSFDHQRAYQIVCLMVGSSPKSFGVVADDYGIDHDRQETCKDDYDLVERSMESLLERQWAAHGQEETKVAIVYEPAHGQYGRAAEVFQSSGIFENIARELRSTHELGAKVTLRASLCDGDANAYYTPDIVEVGFCYELFADLYDLFAGDLPEDPVSSSHRSRTGNTSTD